MIFNDVYNDVKLAMRQNGTLPAANAAFANDPGDYLTLIVRALRNVIRKLENLPETSATATWPVNIQEISLPDNCYHLKRILINGQRVVPQELEDLFGDVDLTYDPTWTVYATDSLTKLTAVGDDAVAYSTQNGVPFNYYLRFKSPMHLGTSVPLSVATTVDIDYVKGPVLSPALATPIPLGDYLQNFVVLETLHIIFRVLRLHQDADAIQMDLSSEETLSRRTVQNMQGDYQDGFVPFPYRQMFTRPDLPMRRRPGM